jgi:hypothetical protein
MKLAVAYRPSLPASASPYRLRDAHDRELDWVNAFLDAQRMRQLAVRSLRAYAYDLLHFARRAQGHPARRVLKRFRETAPLKITPLVGLSR